MNFLYKLISGTCDGYFDWRTTGKKIIILEGPTWVVCRYLNRDAVVAINFDNEKHKNEKLTDWIAEAEDDLEL